MDMSIRFPHLGISLPHVGKTITIFGFDIAYYGIIIALAMIVGISIAMKEAKHTEQNPDTYLDMLMITMVTSVIGARAFYVIFSWEDYKDDLIQIFNTRNGGLAIYGGDHCRCRHGLHFRQSEKDEFSADSGHSMHGTCCRPDHWTVGQFF